MGDYEHYFTPLPFHVHHITFFNKNSMRWRNDIDRPVVRRGVNIIRIKPWAVNLSRVRQAWRIWYRGEPFDPLFFKKRDFEGWRTKTNRQDKWMRTKKYNSIVDYVKEEEGKTLKDVKNIAPEWYLNQLNLYARPLETRFLEDMPEIIKKEQENPRYKLIYQEDEIIGRCPEL